MVYVKNLQFLVMASSSEKLRNNRRGKGYCAYDVSMVECLKALAREGIPELSEGQASQQQSEFIVRGLCVYAVKSAAPVTANVLSVDSRLCQTAPLWPTKVPILGVSLA